MDIPSNKTLVELAQLIVDLDKKQKEAQEGFIQAALDVVRLVHGAPEAPVPDIAVPPERADSGTPLRGRPLQVAKDLRDHGASKLEDVARRIKGDATRASREAVRQHLHALVEKHIAVRTAPGVYALEADIRLGDDGAVRRTAGSQAAE